MDIETSRTRQVSLIIVLLFSTINVYTQSRISSNSEIIFTETFDWENPLDERGWTMPDGYYLEDYNNTGFNWHWWPNDSLLADITFEPPFRSSSPSDGHLCLFANLYNNYKNPPERTGISNSIVFPMIDCSNHPSVIIRFTTSFQNFGYEHYEDWYQVVEVSNNHGVHWASFNAGFGCQHRQRPNDVGPGEAAVFEANITGIAAGMPNILIRIKWQNRFGLYYWIIDDFELAEAYDNDLRIRSIDLQWDDQNPETTESFSFMMPKSQIQEGFGFHLFESSVVNMGMNSQNDIALTLLVKSENRTVFTDEKTIFFLDPEWEETVLLDGLFTPEKSFKTYDLLYNWTQSEEESYPEDNSERLTFIITDSVYSRADDSVDYPFSYRYLEDEEGSNANIDHFIGSVFPIYNGIEVDGISVYIMGGLADGLITYRYVLWKEHRDDFGHFVEAEFLMATDLQILDSSMFHKWNYLPFEKDGESEFIQPGSTVYAGIQYSDFHPDAITRRNKGLTIGADNSTPPHDKRAVGYSPRYFWDSSPHITERNLMVRLLLNDHTNSSSCPEYNPQEVILDQNYPNPFVDWTNIRYKLSKPSSVTIEVFDNSGRVVHFVDLGNVGAGQHYYHLDAKDLASGVYSYKLSTTFSFDTKIMLVY